MFWLLSGPPENWRTAFQHNMWGFKDTPLFKSLVEKLTEGDRFVFYCTAPVSGVIGFGEMKGRVFVGEQPLWPEEKHGGLVIYRHRFAYKPSMTIPEEEWQKRTIRLPELKLSLKIYASVNPVPEKAFALLQETAVKRWGVSEPLPDHDRIKEMIYEIGRLQGLVAQKEYRLEGFRRKHAYVDVAWKPIPSAKVPHQVFEVQIGGNLIEAISKLKHANDIWHSDPFLITTTEQIEEALTLVQGAFHEIQDILRILDWQKIRDLRDAKNQVNALELELGIILRRSAKP